MPNERQALLAAERALSLFVELDAEPQCYCGVIEDPDARGRGADCEGRECGWCEHRRALVAVREALGGAHHHQGLPVDGAHQEQAR